MSYHSNPTRIRTRARVLEAVRWYFRASGLSPSHSEISDMAGIPKQRVGRYLDELQRDEYLTYVKGQACSIVLADPGANLSDLQLRMACIGRGWPDPEPKKPTALADAHPIDTKMPDWAENLLGDIDEKMKSGRNED